MKKFNTILICLLNLIVLNGQNTYNRDEAVAYAEEWWDDRNPDYEDQVSYGNSDCANFVSQCLKAGGLSLATGTNGNGAGVDVNGCIPSCDNLHLHLRNYQNVIYQRLATSQEEPINIIRGDPAIFGTSGGDYWQHAVFAVVDQADGSNLYNAHTSDRNHVNLGWFDGTWNSCDYYHIVSTYNISGYVVIQTNYQGLSGVTITLNNNGGTVVTNSAGYYSIDVPIDWSGTLTPSLDGYSFTPQNKNYISLTGDQTDQNFSAFPADPIISGYIKDENNIGIPGVTVSFSNAGGDVLADANGYYSQEVTSGWTGVSIPSKIGYNFSPVQLAYSSVITSQLNQNFTGSIVHPAADFSGSPTTIKSGESVSFTDLSSNSPTSWSWSFPGGTPSESTQQYPTVSYATAGTYSVTLTATNAGGSNTITKSNYISVNSPISGVPTNVDATNNKNDRVTISWNSVSGASHYIVYRNSINNSASASSISTWITSTSFEDMNANPGVTYYYWVKAATNSSGVNASDFSLFATGFVFSVSSASFTCRQVEYYPNYSVEFTDNSFGDIVEWMWNFGDGYTSTNQNPTHNYYETGTFTVSLVVKNSDDVISEAYEKIIVITDNLSGSLEVFCNSTQGVCEVNDPIFLFGSVSNGTPPYNFQFTLGDGRNLVKSNQLLNSITTEQYSYPNSGRYQVTLKVTDNFGLVGYSMPFTIDVNPEDTWVDTWAEKIEIAYADCYVIPVGGTITFLDKSYPSTAIGGSEWRWDYQNNDCKCSNWQQLWDNCPSIYGTETCTTTYSSYQPYVSHTYNSSGKKVVSYKAQSCQGGWYELAIRWAGVIVVDCNSTTPVFDDWGGILKYWAGYFSLNSLSSINDFNNKKIEHTACNNLVLKPGFTSKPTSGNYLKLKVGDPCLSGGNQKVAIINEIFEYDSIFLETNNNEKEISSKTSIFPNPLKTEFTVRFSHSDDVKSIIVTDLLGRRVWSDLAYSDGDELTIDLSDQPDGVYLLKISDGSGMHMYKLIKQQ